MGARRARAEAQREPEVKSAVQHAIDQAECFEDRYDSAVWYKMMEPRLRKRVPDRDERMAILKNVFCEANRPGELRLPPGLVMAIMEIESNFNRYAVSYAGAVGLMQVMPFWPENLGMRRHQLIKRAGKHPHGLRHLARLSQAREQQHCARPGALQRQHRQTLVFGQGDRPVDALEWRG